jgi:hypothetical protein
MIMPSLQLGQTEPNSSFADLTFEDEQLQHFLSSFFKSSSCSCRQSTHIQSDEKPVRAYAASEIALFAS